MKKPTAEAKPKKDHGPEAERLRKALASVLKDLERGGIVKNRTEWCDRAEIPRSTLRMVLNGSSGSMTAVNYMKLARAAGLPIAVLLGEDAPRNEKEAFMLKAYRSTTDEGQQKLIAKAEEESRSKEDDPEAPLRRS